MQVKIQRGTLSVIAGAALATVLAGVSLAQSPDPLIGTWKLNVGKSTFDPGPAPKSGNLKYEASGQGLNVTVDTDGASGPAHWSYTANFDGKDYPVAGNPDGDMVALKRMTTTTTEAVIKKSGKTMTTNSRVVSADGKTLTITVKGTNAKGQAVHNVQVFEKQ